MGHTGEAEDRSDAAGGRIDRAALWLPPVRASRVALVTGSTALGYVPTKAPLHGIGFMGLGFGFSRNGSPRWECVRALARGESRSHTRAFGRSLGRKARSTPESAFPMHFGTNQSRNFDLLPPKRRSARSILTVLMV